VGFAGVVTILSIAPAGSHRATFVVPNLLRAKEAGQRLEDVVWDPGYSLCGPETGHWTIGPSRSDRALPFGNTLWSVSK
jgi:hypothetical protein